MGWRGEWPEGLSKALALSRASTDVCDIRGDAESGFVASITSAMAMSDFGSAPSLPFVIPKRERRRTHDGLSWPDLVKSVGTLLSCADAADRLSGALTGVLRDMDGCGDPGGYTAPTIIDERGGKGCWGETGKRLDRPWDTAEIYGASADEPEPVRGENAVLFGHYTLRDTVREVQHTSDVRSGRLMDAIDRRGH